MSIREAYEANLHSHGHEKDAAQEEIVDLLDDLQQRLHAGRPRRGLRRWLHGWLILHVPVSVCLVGAVVAHVVMVFASR